MNEKIKSFLIEYNKSKGWGTNDAALLETITESTCIYKVVIDKRRWWNETFKVVEINGLKIGYDWAESTGDVGVRDLGWEFDYTSICEVIEKEKIVKYYERLT